MFQLFQMYAESVYLDVAYIAVLIYICCKHIFQMFRLFQMYIAGSFSYCKCFISRLGKRVQAIIFRGVISSCDRWLSPHVHGNRGGHGSSLWSSAQQRASRRSHGQAGEQHSVGRRIILVACSRERPGAATGRQASSTVRASASS
jgi:hypothetical protein